ncbi:hypothetical protein C8R46DRAFT_1093649 [Mycena filopes]|nr:hypothetical protein C8R46DRAFT_1093649 [Mycena filopes]
MTSQKPPLFPVSFPRNQPPPAKGVLKNGHPTPLYALAWVRSAKEIMGENPGADLSAIRWTVFRPRWREAKYQFPGFLFDPNALVAPAPDDLLVYYTFAYNTEPASMDLATQSDEFLAAWRDTMQIKPEDERTLRWYRFPIISSAHGNPRSWSHKREDVMQLARASTSTNYDLQPPVSTNMASRKP